MKRAKLSTTAPPPIARNPSPADGMTPQWLKNRGGFDGLATELLGAFDDATLEPLDVIDDATSKPLGSCRRSSEFHRCLMGFARTLSVF
ncbi:hypothetical protein [Achromobacter spanius]|uniref:Uncharacterized protein n=1 Tax=Achromobacter spanius TaxID=217203 RepID=A0AA42IV40_9BURK|nr:hypothetical protein [Achromobacter spanius]MDH0735265.1 hypothetical protein [Achromobacter spanius]